MPSIYVTKFMYSDNKNYELCGQMGHLISPSGIGKAQFSSLKVSGDYLHEICRYLNEIESYLNEIAVKIVRKIG